MARNFKDRPNNRFELLSEENLALSFRTMVVRDKHTGILYLINET